MEPAKPLDRDDRAARDSIAGRAQGAVALGQHVARAIPQLQLRPAGGASDRLRMEAPVAGILVFVATIRTHGEGAHGCSRAVIGQVRYNGIPRATMRAVSEGIAIAAIAGV